MADPSAGRTTLVVEGSFGSRPNRDCLRGSCGHDRPADVLSVRYCGTAADALDRLRGLADLLSSAGVVQVGSIDDGAVTGNHDAVRVVSDPADLTGVGMAVTEWVRARDGSAPALVCLDSLSTLLQYVDTERAFRFLHSLTGQFRTNGIDAHAHFDPSAHDERTVAQFRRLFDGRRDDRRDATATSSSASGLATDGGTTSDTSR